MLVRQLCSNPNEKSIAKNRMLILMLVRYYVVAPLEKAFAKKTLSRKFESQNMF